MAEQQKILNQTANLAKKPVDQLRRQRQETARRSGDGAGEAGRIHAGKGRPISPSSPSRTWPMRRCCRELMEVYSEVTMAKDALNAKAVEIATPAEENGLELAKEIIQQPGEVADRHARSPEVEDGRSDRRQDRCADGGVAQGTGGHGRRIDGAAGGSVRRDGGCQREHGRLDGQRRRLGCRGRPDRQHERQGRHRKHAAQQQRDGRPIR